MLGEMERKKAWIIYPSMRVTIPSPSLGLQAFVAQNDSQDRFIAFGERASPQIELLKKVVPLVINHNKRREIFDLDFPDRFHAKLWIFQHLDMFDAVLR